MNLQLKNRKIILGITGSIAAYKACTLCRMLVKQGAEVHVVMTSSSCKLVAPATLEALSGHPVPVDIFEDADKIGHIALAGHADLAVIAPASANTIAKMAAGFADNMLTAAVLACTCKTVVVPAMNTHMLHNPATVENIETLKRRGMLIMQPATGDLACGVNADGRMPEPGEILNYIIKILNSNVSPEGITYVPQDLLPTPERPAMLTQTKLLGKASGAGLKVVITAGPTVEDLDPVRFITNRSSGKMGFALGAAAKALGAQVVLIAGPVKLDTPNGITRINVRSALEMLHAVEDNLKECDVFIGCAAVADYRADHIETQKISKRDHRDGLTIKLVRNPDIVATVGKLENNRPFTVGFAAETENGEEHAQRKLADKNLDLIALNYVQHRDIGFDSDQNELMVFDRDGIAARYGVQDKNVLAASFCDLIFERVKKGQE